MFNTNYPGYPNGLHSISPLTDPKITITPTTIAHCNIPGQYYIFDLSVMNSFIVETSSFRVFVEGNTCVSSPNNAPSIDPAYTFTYDAAAIINEIDLKSATNNNCEY